MSDDPLHFLRPTISLDDSRRRLIVGSATWPVVKVNWYDLVEPVEQTPLDWPVLFNTRAAWVVHENGWGVSVVWGTATHSDNYHHGGAPHATPDFVEEPHQVEVGILHRGELVAEPRGWVTADDLNGMLALLSGMPSEMADARELVELVLGHVSDTSRRLSGDDDE